MIPEAKRVYQRKGATFKQGTGMAWLPNKKEVAPLTIIEGYCQMQFEGLYQ
jgi:hypothetical protein